MKVHLKGFDPELGQKFMEEYGGSVLLRGRSSVKPSTPDLSDDEDEDEDEDGPLPGEDAQQFHDRMQEERDT